MYICRIPSRKLGGFASTSVQGVQTYGIALRAAVIAPPCSSPVEGGRAVFVTAIPPSQFAVGAGQRGDGVDGALAGGW
eukprot:COSAG02_NODE_525_length_20713_cov_5.808286_14_plen_78_part_00